MENNDVITWSKDYLLNWSDFKAESNPSVFEDSSSYIKYHHTWTVNSEMSDGKIYFQIDDIQLSTQFLRHLSWVREKQSSSELLKHEQGHFDLAELLRPIITEKIQNEFNNKKFPTYGQNDEQRKQFARKDSSLMIAKELEKWSYDLSQKRIKYDEDTEFGQNVKKQKEHDEKFNELRKRN
jgi:hypothetical protein